VELQTAETSSDGFYKLTFYTFCRWALSNMGPPQLVASGLPLERPYTFRKCVMEERRRVQRTRVLKGAKIILKGRSSALDCTVCNLTNVGACLHLGSPLGIPNAFDLTFDSARSNRSCQVIWRNKDMLGVAFA
jgi:hypothetical protein